MEKSLSILLPTYYCRCVELVRALHAQCEGVEGLQYEIIVADDGSPEKAYIAENREIEKLTNVRYIVREKNVGRSRIRNFLVGEARYEWVIFIDGDLTLDNPDFIRNYLQADGDVVVGGISIVRDKGLGALLRYRYELASEHRHKAASRQSRAYQSFRTTNFMARHSIMVACPFNERIMRYGYEDVLLGKLLKERGIRIVHIDNPILLDSFEDNAIYLTKMETSCATLLGLKDQLRGYSTLLAYTERLCHWHLLWITDKVFMLSMKAMKANLLGNNPSVFVFNMYKLGYYIHLSKGSNDTRN